MLSHLSRLAPRILVAICLLFLEVMFPALVQLLLIALSALMSPSILSAAGVQQKWRSVAQEAAARIPQIHLEVNSSSVLHGLIGRIHQVAKLSGCLHIME